MSVVGLARRFGLCALLCVLASGCFQDADSQLDEKKEPNFINGMNLVSSMDYQGAIESFEKAVEVNPRSASAHFELGWLYEEKAAESDPAAAIYHYNSYLKYSSHPDNADVVRQIINRCKLELAKSISAAGPVPSASQRELDRLTAENKDLHAQVDALQAKLAQPSAATVRYTPTPVSPTRVQGVEHRTPPNLTDNARPATVHTTVATATRPATISTKTHVIKSGETMAAIARHYGVSLGALSAANPQVTPTRLRVGQALQLPAT
jgi:LysM repeat protein